MQGRHLEARRPEAFYIFVAAICIVGLFFIDVEVLSETYCFFGSQNSEGKGFKMEEEVEKLRRKVKELENKLAVKDEEVQNEDAM